MGWLKPSIPFDAESAPFMEVGIASDLPSGTLRLVRGIIVQGPRPAGVSWGASTLEHQWHRYEQWFPGLVDEAYARDELGDRLDALIADGTFQRGAS